MFANGVKLSKDAWYMKLMKFMWDLDYNNFPNLCPLFWSVVGSIVILPIYLIIAPFARVKILRETVITIGKCFIALGALLLFGIGILAMAALSVPVLYTGLLSYGDLAWWITGVIIISPIIICFSLSGLIYLCECMSKLYRQVMPKKVDKPVKIKKEKKDSLIVSFIVSVYRKNCPFITWK